MGGIKQVDEYQESRDYTKQLKKEISRMGLDEQLKFACAAYTIFQAILDGCDIDMDYFIEMQREIDDSLSSSHKQDVVQ